MGNEMMNTINIPMDAMRFSGKISGWHAKNKGDIHVSTIFGQVAGIEPLWITDDPVRGTECEIIIIPKRKLTCAPTTNGNRVRYGDILTAVSAMFEPDAFIETMNNVVPDEDGD